MRTHAKELQTVANSKSRLVQLVLHKDSVLARVKIFVETFAHSCEWYRLLALVHKNFLVRVLSFSKTVGRNMQKVLNRVSRKIQGYLLLATPITMRSFQKLIP